jgi:predicted MFS family arabinose efflux permease
VRSGSRWRWSCSASDPSSESPSPDVSPTGSPHLLLGLATPLLLVGWLALALVATHPLLLVLVFVQGLLAFAVGSTLIARVLYVASEAPTMGGSYATAALNIGAAAGPAVGALALPGSGVLGPVWVAAVLTGITLLVLLPSLRLISPGPHQSPALLGPTGEPDRAVR